MDMAQNLKLEKKEGVATLELYRPQKKNSLNTEMRHELEGCLKELANDPSVRVVVITGGAEIFCAGADISEIEGTSSAEEAYKHAREFQVLFDQLESLPQPTVAAVSGYALGGGCELALACDFRIASDTAKFGLPEIKIGAFPGGGGTQRLPRAIGVAKAKEMILLGDPINAEQALAIGLVLKVVAKDKLMAEVQSYAAKIAALPRLALQASKMLINKSQEIDLATGLEFEARTFGGIAHTHDLAEGTKAFMEKRKPNFTGN
jgi:enoyl-CoA hydratase